MHKTGKIIGKYKCRSIINASIGLLLIQEANISFIVYQWLQNKEL